MRGEGRFAGLLHPDTRGSLVEDTQSYQGEKAPCQLGDGGWAPPHRRGWERG